MYQKVTLSKLELSSSPSPSAVVTLPPPNHNQIDITKINLKCDHCNKSIRRFGLIYIIPLKNLAVFFCSRHCKKTYIKHDIIRTCIQCGTEIPRIGNQRYCSKDCASLKLFTCQNCGKSVIDKSSRVRSVRKYCSKTCANRVIATKYKSYYFCDMCHDWIKRADAKTMKADIKTFKVCPKIGCNNNKLRTRARRAKAKDKEAKKFYYE